MKMYIYTKIAIVKVKKEKLTEIISIKKSNEILKSVVKYIHLPNDRVNFVFFN
jgi:hypothetical protein